MPGSVLWIGLVVVWLFVLVPMVVRQRPSVRRTSDDALSTRVLHRGGDALPSRTEASHEDSPPYEPVVPPLTVRRPDLEEAQYETGYEAEEYDDYSADRRGRGGFDPEGDALLKRAAYVSRQRVALVLLAVILISAAMALVAAPVFWAVCAAAVAILAGYLAFLRRQVKVEQDIRARRLARLRRAHEDRLRAEVLDVDDEDPDFDYLGDERYYSYGDYNDDDYENADGGFAGAAYDDRDFGYEDERDFGYDDDELEEADLDGAYEPGPSGRHSRRDDGDYLDDFPRAYGS
jgi:general stress protein CsbA